MLSPTCEALPCGCGLVLTVWKVTVRVVQAASAGSVDDDQMVTPWHKEQDAHNQDDNGPAGPHVPDVAGQQKAARQDQSGADQSLQGGTDDGLVRNLSRAFVQEVRSHDTRTSLIES